MGEMNIYTGQTAVSLCFQGTGCIHNLFLNEHPRSYAVRGLPCHPLNSLIPTGLTSPMSRIICACHADEGRIVVQGPMLS